MEKINLESMQEFEGKYLTFKLQNEVYGVNVHSILQIIAVPKITPVPKTPNFVKGVINLRGKIIPVIDLRTKFCLEFQDYTHRTAIIIVKIFNSEKESLIGVIVDLVLEVVDIKENQIEEKPSFGIEVNTEYILGMAKMKKNVITLLEIEKVLTRDELVLFNEGQNSKEVI